MKPTALVLLIFSLLFYSSNLHAEETLEEKLLNENKLLKERIAHLESQLASYKETQDTNTNVSEPEKKPDTPKGWPSDIHEGLDRIDKFFYVPETQAWGAIEYQIEGRSHNTMELFGGMRLPAGFSTFAFLRWESSDDNDQSSADFNRFFIEMDLQYEILNGAGVVGEYNDEQFNNDATYRLGAYYLPDWEWLKEMDLVLFTKYFPWSSQEEQHNQWTIVWNWSPKDVLDGRFKLSGFYEINAVENHPDTTQVVTDVQFLYRLFGNIGIFTEYRFNAFENEEKTWVYGIQYEL